MIVRTHSIRVIRDQPTEFEALRGQKVLIYWPHGFGDWVFLSYILPQLDPSNRYFVTRIGDHNTSVFDRSEWATPLYIGANELAAGSKMPKGREHFGLRMESSGMRNLTLPAALEVACVQNEIDVIVDLPFWEVYGRASFPWHTKARNMLRGVVDDQQREQVAPRLSKALPSAIDFNVPEWVTVIVEGRLRTHLDVGRRKLCVITRNGYTNCDKNWGHLWRDEAPGTRMKEGEECRDFMRLMLKRDPSWAFLVMEDRVFRGDDTVSDRNLNCASFAELFGGLDSGGIPFGLVAKAILKCADLAIGVPAGMFHLAMAYRNVPVVGVWTNFFPSWWDEPNSSSRHLVGRHVSDSQRDSLAGSFSAKDELSFRIRRLETRIIPGAEVMEEVACLGV